MFTRILEEYAQTRAGTDPTTLGQLGQQAYRIVHSFLITTKRLLDLEPPNLTMAVAHARDVYFHLERMSNGDADYDQMAYEFYRKVETFLRTSDCVAEPA